MEVARIRILASFGRKACIGNFSVGTPDVTRKEHIEAFYPAIDSALQYGGILGLHEYSAPLMSSAYEGSTETGEGWLTGRYRKLYKNFLIPSGRKIKAVFTENGIDGGVCPITGCH